MNLEKFISFVTHHNEAIIQWLFFGILVLAGALIARALFGKKTDDNSVSGNDLQSALEKILAQTSRPDAAGGVAAGLGVGAGAVTGVPADVAAQLQSLKADLSARESELNALKASGGGGAGAAPTDEQAALAARIKELEAKLSEYEILEDDIADLSLYKDENARLKTELERLKNNSSGAAPAAPSEGSEKLVEEFAQAVEDQPAEDPNAADLKIPDTGDPMADFESTVKMEKELATPEEFEMPDPLPPEPEPVVPAASAAPEPPAPVAVAPTPAPVAAPAATAPAAPPAIQSQTEADDLFAEFSTPIDDGNTSLDTDKMMAEMAALVSVEPSAGNSLEEAIDTDKMAAEATSLGKA